MVNMSIADNGAIHIAFFKGGLLLDGGVCRRTSTPDVRSYASFDTILFASTIDTSDTHSNF